MTKTSSESEENETRLVNQTMPDNLSSSRNQKRFFFTSETNENVLDITESRKNPPESQQTDSERPPGDQPWYHTRQVVAGQPVYQYGPPPPPERAGRIETIRSGQETARAREERGQRPEGGIGSLFGRRRSEDEDSQHNIFLFNTVELRNRFVRKVYLILTVQLLITFGFVLLAIHVEPMRGFFKRDRVGVIVVACLAFVVIIAVSCSQTLRKRSPYNFIALCIITLLYAYILASISSIAETVAVYMAIGCTAVICFLVSILACQMKWDITKCGCVLYILLLGLMIYGIICAILVLFVSPETFKVMHLVYSGIGLAIFILYLMYDTQLILGGRKYELSPEEYILGALMLYIDIIMIFIHLLGLLRE